MIKTIAHIADVHFKNYQRHEEYKVVCDNFLHHLSQIKPDRIVIAGDLVHSKNNITPELVYIVSNFLTDCSKLTKKVILIPGNHDIVQNNKDRMDALVPILNALNNDKIVYYNRSNCFYDENVIWVVYSLYDDNQAPENIPPFTDNKLKIGLYHGIINGATDGKGYVFKNIGLDTDNFSDCDLVLCGDIHKRQVLKTALNKPIIMVGSLIQQGFGENVTEHGFNILNIADDNTFKYNFIDINNQVKYLKFEINDIEDITNESEKLLNY